MTVGCGMTDPGGIETVIRVQQRVYGRDVRRVRKTGKDGVWRTGNPPNGAQTVALRGGDDGQFGVTRLELGNEREKVVTVRGRGMFRTP